MKIIVLDAYTLNPGDLSWKGLEALGNCEIYERSSPGEVLKRAGGAEIILVNKIVLNREAIAALPLLKYIGVTATGYNIIDIAAARERKIVVTNVPSYGTRSVAQMTFALLLELTQHVGHHARTVREGRWSACPDFCYWDYPLIELDTLTLGIVGLGRIGRAMAQLGSAFGMRVLAHTRASSAQAKPAGIELVDLETLFRQSDVISLHCPLTPETRHLVNAERLGWLKPSALLLNTSRGPLIDEAALLDALNSGRIAGAGLDVLAVEPPPKDHPLLHANNCLITPHIAWATRSARSRLLEAAVGNVKAFLEGKPLNVVN
jgi:glycerate dehydrogenase